jgi:hypothetical protein
MIEYKAFPGLGDTNVVHEKYDFGPIPKSN